MTGRLSAEKILKNKLEAFTCKRCGNCCRGSGVVRITPEDARRVARFLRISIDDFYTKYTISFGADRWLKDKQNQECIFLKENLCQVHEVKPEQCASFPQKWHNPDFLSYCAGFKD